MDSSIKQTSISPRSQRSGAVAPPGGTAREGDMFRSRRDCADPSGGLPVLQGRLIASSLLGCLG
eukprot:5573679-Pyramimonas_sp.AAC.1